MAFTTKSMFNVRNYLDSHGRMEEVLIRDAKAEIECEKVKARGEEPNPYLIRRRDNYRYISEKYHFFSSPRNIVKDDLLLITYLNTRIA